MPYSIQEQDGNFLIVRNADGQVVGKSDARDKAERSIGYRIDAEKKKEQNGGASATR